MSNKYGNRVVVKNGERFDSVREYERHLVLLDMQKKGEIRYLCRQPKYPLVVNKVKIATYIGDWAYIQMDGEREHQLCVEDAKGFQTPEFKLKWKLCKAIYPPYDWRLS